MAFEHLAADATAATSGIALLATALALGLRHGIDWDHIAAIADITSTTAATEAAEEVHDAVARGQRSAPTSTHTAASLEQDVHVSAPTDPNATRPCQPRCRSPASVSWRISAGRSASVRYMRSVMQRWSSPWDWRR